MSKAALTLLIPLCLAAPPLLAVAALPRPADGPVLALHMPWQDGAALVRRAGGTVIGPIEGALGTLAAAPDGAALGARLMSAGAWAVIDGRAAAAFCQSEPTRIFE